LELNEQKQFSCLVGEWEFARILCITTQEVLELDEQSAQLEGKSSHYLPAVFR
jgi:hypothetical protein